MDIKLRVARPAGDWSLNKNHRVATRRPRPAPKIRVSPSQDVRHGPSDGISRSIESDPAHHRPKPNHRATAGVRADIPDTRERHGAPAAPRGRPWGVCVGAVASVDEITSAGDRGKAAQPRQACARASGGRRRRRVGEQSPRATRAITASDHGERYITKRSRAGISRASAAAVGASGRTGREQLRRRSRDGGGRGARRGGPPG
jgi:hypothetical protein